MHIGIVGPGALGCLLTSFFLRGKQSADIVSLLDYDEKRAKLIRSQGIICQEGATSATLPVKIYTSPSTLNHVDALFLCVKSYDIEKTLDFCLPLLTKDTLLIFMQNGIGHLQYDGKAGHAATAFGTTTEGATVISEGCIRHAGKGNTHFGFLHKPSRMHTRILEDVVTRLRSSGTSVEISESIITKLWSKLFINVGINALTVIHNCKNGELLNLPDALHQMEKAIEETEKTAAAVEISIPSPLKQTLAVCSATAENISSMLQDVQKGRKTEIDAINGAVAALAKKFSIEVPMNEYLVAEVKKRTKTPEQQC